MSEHIKNLVEKRNQLLVDAHKLLQAETVTRENRKLAKSLMTEADAVHAEIEAFEPQTNSTI